MKHFLRERLEFYLRDALGFSYDVVNAVLAADADDVVDAVARAEAVTQGPCICPNFESICGGLQAHAQHPEAGEGSRHRVGRSDFSHLQDSADEEKSWLRYVATQAAKSRSAPAEEGIIEQALVDTLHSYRPADRSFFDKVMVMVEDERVRANRLALLQTC